MIKLTKDAWLSDVMARPVHRIAVDGVVGHALDEPRGFYFSRVATSDIRAANALAAIGFRIVDTGVILECAMDGDKSQGTCARMAVPDDRDAVMAIARDGFRYSRFHLDPEIPTVLANEIKAQWAGNFFRGQRGDHMIVAEAGNEVAGFLQILRTIDGAAVVDLIAVGSPWRGRGLGSAMIKWAAAHVKQSRMRVGTQTANVGSLRFYENLGFRTVSSAYVMHLHA